MGPRSPANGTAPAAPGGYADTSPEVLKFSLMVWQQIGFFLSGVISAATTLSCSMGAIHPFGTNMSFVTMTSFTPAEHLTCPHQRSFWLQALNTSKI